MSRPKHNPETYPDRNHSDEPNYRGVSTVGQIDRPYRWFLVRVDDGRLSRLDDHPDGRITVRGAGSRHVAVGWKATFERDSDAEYIVGYEPAE